MLALQKLLRAVAGLKAWQRMRFARTVRLLTDLDEDGLKYVLKNLPAWVKVRLLAAGQGLADACATSNMTANALCVCCLQFSDYERAK
jgi:hypothetical protein